jgi:Stage II sporulation protein E (SpoIIE)
VNEQARSPQLLERESDIVRVLAEAATLDDATHEILAALAAWFGWDVGLLWVPDDDLGLLRCAASWSSGDPRLVEFLRVSDRLMGAIELRRGDLSFGERELERVLCEHVGQSAEVVVDAVAERVEKLQDGSLRDDVALLALRAVSDA